MMKWFLKVLFSGALICGTLACNGLITYKLQIVQGPIAAIAEDRVSYTNLTFFAHNDQTDFLGYEISTGLSKNESLTFTNPEFCAFTANSNIKTKPTLVQIGGTALNGFDCFISAIGPLTPGTWISVRSKRNCSLYVDATNCNEVLYSDASSTEVLGFVAQPSKVVITSVTDQVTQNSYYLLTVSVNPVPTGFNGIGLFYSETSEEARYKASRNGIIRDAFCGDNEVQGGSIASIASTRDVIIQIGGGRVSGSDCYYNNIYVNTGNTIAVRNSVNRTDFPWSNFRSVTVP